MIDLAAATDLIVRVTLVLAGALLLSRLLRSAPAIARHRLWSATIALILAMPLLIGYLPQIGIPGWLEATGSMAATTAATAATLPTEQIAADVVALPVYRVESEPVGAAAVSPSLAVTGSGSLWVDLLMIAWALGAVVMLLALMLGMIRGRRLRLNAQPIRSGRLHDRLLASCTLMRYRRRVALALSDRIRSPLAGGVFRPTVLLPSAAVEWDDQLLDTVLRHELIHLRRHDTIQQLGARLSVAWYWFHPLAWIAAARSALAREQACDEAVLALGTRPSSYARSLVELAEFGTSSTLMPALARLRRPELEERVISILRTDRPERSTGRTAFAIAAMAAWTFTIAAAGPVIAQEPAPEPPAPPRATAPAPPPAPPRVIAAAPAPTAPPAPAPEVAMEPGRVIAPAPAPAAVPVPPIRAVIPAVPTAPAPPAPPAECGSAKATTTTAASGNRSRLMIRRDLDGRKVCMSVDGKLPAGFKLSPLGELPAGVVLTLSAKSGDREQLMVITGTASGNRTSWRVDGNDRAVDTKATAWRDAMLSVLGKSVRRNGVVVAERADLERSRAMVARSQAELASRQAGMANEQRAVVAAQQARIERAQARVAERQQTVVEMRARASADEARAREVQRDIEARQHDLVDQATREQAVVAREQARVAEVQARVEAMNRDRQRVAQVEQRAQVAHVQEQVARQRAVVERQRTRVAEVEARTRAAVQLDAPAVQRLIELIDAIK